MSANYSVFEKRLYDRTILTHKRHPISMYFFYMPPSSVEQNYGHYPPAIQFLYHLGGKYPSSWPTLPDISGIDSIVASLAAEGRKVVHDPNYQSPYLFGDINWQNVVF